MKLTRLAVAAMAVTLAVSPALAGAGADILRKSLYSGALAAGIEELQPLAAADPEARFGLGFLGFMQGVEKVLQAMYRHGLAAPTTGPMGPVLGVPVPANSSPEPLDYETLRGVFEQLVTDLDTASEVLVSAGASGDYVVMLDPTQFRVDINGDGKAEGNESVAGVLGDPSLAGPAMTPEGGGQPETPAGPPVAIGFDRADAIWMGGYTTVIAAQMDFFLAHDFSDSFNAVFHRFFPRAGLPMQEFADGGMLFMDPETDTAIADFVATVHTINWPVVDAERLRRIPQRAERVIGLSRENWKAILAETDDEAELVPSPRQTALDGSKVTDEMVAAWHDTLDKAEQIIKGELLVPHWRFRQGFDLRAYFETAERTDLVMLLTGYGALPYLKDGPIADAETFAAANRAFGENLLGYVFWFN